MANTNKTIVAPVYIVAWSFISADDGSLHSGHNVYPTENEAIYDIAENFNTILDMGYKVDEEIYKKMHMTPSKIRAKRKKDKWVIRLEHDDSKRIYGVNSWEIIAVH